MEAIETVKQAPHTHTEHRLIDSTYEASEALPVLLSLIQDKIEFLGFRIQGHKERSLEDVQHLEDRVHALAQTRRELSNFLKALEGKKVKVDCRIKIDVVP